MFHEAKPRETLRSRGSKTHCFPWDQSLSVLLYLQLKKETVCFTPACSQICKEHELITCESKVHVVVSLFVRLRPSEFDSWHVASSPSIGRLFE